MQRFVAAAIFAVCSCIALTPNLGQAQPDETSSQDKLRILYSNGFTFTSQGLPLVTVELMSSQTQVRLGSDDATLVLPDGEGGALVDAGPGVWTVSVEKSKPGTIR